MTNGYCDDGVCSPYPGASDGVGVLWPKYLDGGNLVAMVVQHELGGLAVFRWWGPRPWRWLSTCAAVVIGLEGDGVSQLVIGGVRLQHTRTGGLRSRSLVVTPVMVVAGMLWLRATGPAGMDAGVGGFFRSMRVGMDSVLGLRLWGFVPRRSTAHEGFSLWQGLAPRS
jgi:hypothetical protein